MSDRLSRPFTKEQVKALNEFQNNEWHHPFTCGGDRMDAAHRSYQAIHGGDFGQLVATEHGWVCPVCGYTQSFAYGFMTIPRNESQP